MTINQRTITNQINKSNIVCPLKRGQVRNYQPYRYLYKSNHKNNKTQCSSVPNLTL